MKGRLGLFSVKSMYKSLCNQEVENPLNQIWKAKIPLKIKIFMWLIFNNAILTKDNLVKRKWVGDVRCSFCCDNESIPHLMFECTTAKYVWSMVAVVLGARRRPGSMEQFWVWVKTYIPQQGKIYMPGLAAICWSLWTARNRCALKIS